MKSRMIAVAVLVVLLGVQGALGSIFPSDDIKVFRWSARPAGQSQGPFWAVIYDDDPNMGVGSGTTIEPKGMGLTFCVERTELFSPGTRYNIDTITAKSVATGRWLTGYTAWVYDKFLRDFYYLPGQVPNATGYGWHNYHGPETPPGDPLPKGWKDGGVGGTWGTWVGNWGTVMNLYQQAIWAGMVGTDGIVGSGAGGAVGAEYAISDWSDYEEIAIGLTSFQNSGWTGLQGYRVMNLGKDGTNYQDHLLPPGGWTSTIPEPASLAIWSLIGLTFAAVWWHRRKSSLSN